MSNPIEKSLFLVKDKENSVDSADTVVSVEEAEEYLRYHYESLQEALAAEKYELAARIRDQLKIVWERFQKKITDLIYDVESGKLIEVVSTKEGATEFVDYNELSEKREKVFWEGDKKVEESDWKTLLFSKRPNEALNIFETETGLSKKVADINKHDGNYIKPEKLDLIIEIDNYLAEFETYKNMASEKLKNIWEFSCLSSNQPLSEYQNQLSYFTNIEFDISENYFRFLKKDTLLALEYWQTISDNAEIIVRRLTDVKNSVK